MHAQNNTRTSDNQLDFSSALMHATSAEQFSTMDNLSDDFDHTHLNQAQPQNNVRENRNLSNVLTNISDEGSIKPRPKKLDRGNNGLKDKATDTKRQAETTPLKPPVAPVTNLYQLTADEQDNFFRDDAVAIKDKPRLSLWQPLILSLALTLTVIMGYNLFQLHDQTNEMQLTLKAYQEQIDELRISRNESTGNATDVNNELSRLKLQIDTLRSDQANFDTQLTQNSIDTLKPQFQAISSFKDFLNEVQTNLQATRNEINAIKSAIETRPVATNDTITANHWGVNLASLSSREQVQTGLSMLEKSGRVPLVQEIKINGSTVYRLSVEGFATYEEATEFIGTAKKKYGFDGGWVRRS